MDGYEDNRRWVLRRLGFTFGGTLTASSLISANIVETDTDKNIVLLSEQTKKWQFKLHEYMNDNNFARYFMKATERITLKI